MRGPAFRQRRTSTPRLVTGVQGASGNFRISKLLYSLPILLVSDLSECVADLEAAGSIAAAV